MKKFYFAVVFLILGTGIFAFDGKGTAQIRVFPNEAPLKYDFYYVDLNDISDIMALGLTEGSWTHMYTRLLFGTERKVIANNTSLSQSVKDAMRQRGANICCTLYNGLFYVNIFMPNGRYTTIIYEVGT